MGNYKAYEQEIDYREYKSFHMTNYTKKNSYNAEKKTIVIYVPYKTCCAEDAKTKSVIVYSMEFYKRFEDARGVEYLYQYSDKGFVCFDEKNEAETRDICYEKAREKSIGGMVKIKFYRINAYINEVPEDVKIEKDPIVISVEKGHRSFDKYYANLTEDQTAIYEIEMKY